MRWSAGGIGGVEVVEFRLDAGDGGDSEQEHVWTRELECHRIFLWVAPKNLEECSADCTRSTRYMRIMISG